MRTDFDRICKMILQEASNPQDSQQRDGNLQPEDQGQSQKSESQIDFDQKEENEEEEDQDASDQDKQKKQRKRENLDKLKSIARSMRAGSSTQYLIKFIVAFTKMDQSKFFQIIKLMDGQTKRDLEVLVRAFKDQCVTKGIQTTEAIDVQQLKARAVKLASLV